MFFVSRVCAKGVPLYFLLTGDAGVGGSNGSGAEDDEPPAAFRSSMKGGGGDRAGGQGAAGILEAASLSEYAKYTLKTICSQEWVNEIFLKDPEKLWTPEVLLDEVLTCKQVSSHRICGKYD